jgi:hypothetical protein
MSQHYSTHQPEMLIKKCGQDEWHIIGELFVCMECARGAIVDCPNVLGYLTLMEHRQYRKYATLCMQLFQDGYAVIPCDQWEAKSVWKTFPLDEFFTIVSANKSIMAKLPNENGGGP